MKLKVPATMLFLFVGILERYAYCFIKSFDLPSEKLTLLHSERPKLYGVLAFLGAIGLKSVSGDDLALPSYI